MKIVIKNVIFLFSNKNLSKVKSEKNEQIFTHNNINLKKTQTITNLSLVIAALLLL